MCNVSSQSGLQGNVKGSSQLVRIVGTPYWFLLPGSSTPGLWVYTRLYRCFFDFGYVEPVELCEIVPRIDYYLKYPPSSSRGC